MPRKRIGDIDVYYEIHGDGPQTLVMIRGLGSNLLAWSEQTPELSKHFRLVLFDNRGAGRTDKPDAPYTPAQMAADTAGLLDALSIKRCALLGISMGGMIAQEFALAYQDRLSALVLGCTHSGGSSVVQPAPEMIAALLAGTLATPDQQKTQLRGMFTDVAIAHRPDMIKKHEAIRSQFAAPPYSYARQAQGVMSFDASARLGEIRVPTMVITGTDDRLVPPGNSRAIAERIPSATLKGLPGGHLFFFEHPDLFNKAVIDFVKAHP